MAEQGHRSDSPADGWERFFWLTFNRSTLPIGLFDAQRVGVAFNQAACDFNDRPRAELIGRKLDADISPPTLKQFRRDWDRFMRIGDWLGSVDLVRRDGTVVHTEVAARAAVIGGRRLVVAVVLPWAGVPTTAVPSLEAERDLTPRERTVVHLLSLGLTSPEIAERLSISTQTARTHVRNAMAKTGTKTRAQLVAVALADGRLDETVAA